MLEKKLHDELKRYKQINKYGSKMIMEQDAPEPPIDPAAPVDPAAPIDPAAPVDPAAPPMDAPVGDAPADGGTEEIDITDLVNMTKSIKNNIDDNKADHVSVLNKMDDVFSKLTDLEAKLGEMDQVVAKIDQLGVQVQQMKPETPQEKLEMRSLDSYPFNQRPNEFFNQKQGEMRASGKNEYVLTKQDVQDYSPDTIKTSFNPDERKMNLSSNVNFLLGLQIQMKINHWQTKGFARHNAFGGFYDSLSDLIDTFVESAMGKYGRFTLDEETKTIQLSNLSELDMKGLVNTVRESLVQMSEQLEPSDTDLLNIRDEMLGELNKLSYLLTLE